MKRSADNSPFLKIRMRRFCIASLDRLSAFRRSGFEATSELRFDLSVNSRSHWKAVVDSISSVTTLDAIV